MKSQSMRGDKQKNIWVHFPHKLKFPMQNPIFAKRLDDSGKLMQAAFQHL